MNETIRKIIASFKDNLFKWERYDWPDMPEDKKGKKEERSFDMKAQIFGIFHKGREQVMSQVEKNYFGNKEEATNAAVDHVASMRLVNIRAADHGHAGLCCVTLDFGDNT